MNFPQEEKTVDTPLENEQEPLPEDLNANITHMNNSSANNNSSTNVNNYSSTNNNLRIFESKYDIEFIGLLNEIGSRLVNFNKHDKLKIKSWINLLTFPCDTNETKKNRNLYGIKLINQMINGKLEEPFNKYANDINDLKWLSPIDIKAELTKKFFDEIDFRKIEQFGERQQKLFIENHPEIQQKIINKQSGKKIEFGNYEEEDGNNTNFGRNMTGEYMNNSNNNDNVFVGSEKAKLINIIRDLEQKVIERDEIIELQSKQIEDIKKQINYLKGLQNKEEEQEGEEEGE